MSSSSMTAFARASIATEQVSLIVELRSVNHRYLDCTFKLPESLTQLESVFRNNLRKKLHRGKIDCLLRIEGKAVAPTTLHLNQDLLDQLLQLSDHINTRSHNLRPATTLDILQFPGICSADTTDNTALEQQAESLFSEALASLIANRQREGEQLATLIHQRLDAIDHELSAVRSALPVLRQHQQDKLRTKLADIGADANIDPSRLEQELVYLAQKSDVDEELDRFDAHIKEVKKALRQSGPSGRRLDFLMQELNREANTLASKSTQANITHNAVELKVLIEQMREQIQNIE